MKKLFRDETEPIGSPISNLLASYRRDFAAHPLFAARDRLPTPLLVEFAFHQYCDSILWIPMLALMRARVRLPRLGRAIEDNIACEAGLGGTAHVELARRLMRSLGVAAVGDLPTGELRRSAGIWLSDDFAAWTEPEISGWLLVAETLVPIMFAAMAPAYARTACDVAYFSEHIAVDVDEHAAVMAEAVDEVVARHGPAGVLDGMRLAWRETLEVPDAVHRKLTG